MLQRNGRTIPSVRDLLHIALFGCLFCAAAAAADSEFEQLNRLRAAAGLPTLDVNVTLVQAARHHAAYLDRHREPGKRYAVSAHQQQAGRAGFSGDTPSSRVLAAGYPHGIVRENVSMGYDSADQALSGLMSAIYHRLTFLDLDADEVGIAVGEWSRVFLLGRSDLRQLCVKPPRQAISRTAVDCLGTDMTRDYYEAMCADLPQQALFKAPHPVSCPNDRQLSAAFMKALCEQPPAAARFRGHGRYYVPCNNGTRVDADWFNRLCAAPPASAQYTPSGSYYEICEPPQKVFAEWLEKRCATLPPVGRETGNGMYRRPCASEHNLRVDYLDRLDDTARAELPTAVIWPPRDAVDVPPAFFIEEPDPLPDLEVSGYPLSVQFNPARVDHVSLVDFALYRLEGEQQTRITATRLLDHRSDPHQTLSAHEFALFPLQRLDWGSSYRAVVEVLLDGAPQRIEWTFQTRGGDLPLLVAADPRQRYRVRPGIDYLLYLPPDGDQARTVASTRIEFRRGNTAHLEAVDQNTLRLRIAALHCSPIVLTFQMGRVVELIPAGCAG